MLFLFGFLIVWSEGVRAEYDPQRCPDAQAMVTVIINGEKPAEPAFSRAGQLVGDIVCTICCHAPLSAVRAITAVHDSDVVKTVPEAVANTETPLVVQFESLRPPRI